jgi:hypothetical protein
VREYFQRDIERTKKETWAQERLAREAAATAGNNPAGGYDDEEAQLTCQEQKQSSNREWKREDVLMSVEGVVVRRG